MKIDKDIDFACIVNDERSQVFQLYPSIYGDKRGSFCEVLKNGGGDDWIFNTYWIQQINRSKSIQYTVRGMHAQAGKSCQGKLVQAVNGIVYDIIVDARPDSQTFGLVKAYKLDSETQNMLWVPRGFLHGFAVPEQNQQAVFEYMCDNVYDHSAEFSVSPVNFIENASEDKAFINVFKENTVFSDKDLNGLKSENWMSSVRSEYFKTGSLWYR